MRVRHEVLRKVTISLPAELVDFADRQAIRYRSNRSKIISRALAEVKSHDEECLAVEGYRFYAQEAELFAASSASATAEAWGADYLATEDPNASKAG